MIVFKICSGIFQKTIQVPTGFFKQAKNTLYLVVIKGVFLLPYRPGEISGLRSEFITEETYFDLKSDILEDIEDTDIINLTPSVLKITTELLEENVLRSLDAIHIACALGWQSELFVSSDERQGTAAIVSGLKVEFI